MDLGPYKERIEKLVPPVVEGWVYWFIRYGWAVLNATRDDFVVDKQNGLVYFWKSDPRPDGEWAANWTDNIFIAARYETEAEAEDAAARIVMEHPVAVGNIDIFPLRLR